MLNSRSPRVMDVVPTFYTAEGTPIIGQNIRLQPTEIRFISIESLIPAEHRGQHLWGGMSLSYTGNLMEVWAQIALSGTVRAGGAADVTFNVLDNRGSSVQEAVWRTPERGATILAFGNSSSAPVRASLRFADGERQEIALEAFATRYVRRSSRNRSNDAVRVTLESGAMGALKAVGVITSGGGGFAGSVRFVDPQGVVQPNLFATNLRLRDHAPHLLLRNVGGETVTARARFLAATGEAGELIELPAVTVRPQETVEVNLRSLLEAATNRTDMESVSVQIINSGAAGSLIGALYSTDRVTNIAYDMPLRDSGRVRTSTGSYPWRTDGDYSTVVTVTNVGSAAGRFLVDIRYAGGTYTLAPRELAAGATATFDLREIQNAQEPNGQGRTLPQSITSGQFHWSILGAPSGSKLIGRAEVTSLSSRASNSYSCPTCCPVSGPYGGFGAFAPVMVGSMRLASTEGEYRDCYYQTTPTTIDMREMWGPDAEIAWIRPIFGGQIEVYGVGAGETLLGGRYDRHEWRSAGAECYHEQSDISAELPIEVRPRIDSISPERGLVGNTVNVAISGQGFRAGQTTVNAGAGIAVSNVMVNSSTQLTANFAVDVNAAGGNRSVTVTVRNQQSISRNFFVQIPTTLRRFDFPPGAPNGYGPLTLTADTNYEVRDAAGRVALTNECGVYRNLVYELVDQEGEPITQPFDITESFYDYQGPVGTPSDFTRTITGLVGDIIYFGRPLPNCLGPNDNESFRQRTEVRISGRAFPLTIINRIVRGRFSGEYRTDVTIERP